MKTKTFSLIALAIITAVISAIWFGYSTYSVDANGYVGLAVTQRTAVTTEVGPDTVNNIFDARRNCTNRVISITGGGAVPIHFITAESATLSSTTLSTTNGLIQSASTTQAYEAGIYGCGEWYATAVSSTTITLVEYQ